MGASTDDGVWGGLCPLCREVLLDPSVLNALSHADNTTVICSRCGMREAVMVPQIERREGLPRTAFYYDEVGGVMLVEENAPGYTPFAEAPVADGSWCRQYVDAWNAKLGLSRDDVTAIVTSSMFPGTDTRKRIWIEVTETATYSGWLEVDADLDVDDQNALEEVWTEVEDINPFFDSVLEREVSVGDGTR